MSTKVRNNATTTLASGISNSDVTAVVHTGDGALFDAIVSPDVGYATIRDATNIEIVQITNRTGDTFTIVRGQDGSTAHAFSIGAIFEQRWNVAAVKGLIADSAVSVTTSYTSAISAAISAALTTVAGMISSAIAALGLGTASTKNVGTGAGNVVMLDGSAKLPAVDGSQLTNLPTIKLSTVHASTSGSTADFTTLPATLKQIIVSLDGVSQDLAVGSATMSIKLSTGASFAGSGYNAVSHSVVNGVEAHASGFTFPVSSGSGTYGSVVFTLLDPATNTWSAEGVLSDPTQPDLITISGTVALSGVLDGVRLAAGGGHLFDAGKINIAYIGS